MNYDGFHQKEGLETNFYIDFIHVNLLIEFIVNLLKCMMKKWTCLLSKWLDLPMSLI